MAIQVLRLRCRATVGLCVLACGALIGALLVAASPGIALAAGCATAGSQVTCTFSYDGTNGGDGTPQHFVVPIGVTSVTIEAWGAQGGENVTSEGLGGHVKGTVSVTPTESLTVRVGGQPGAAGGYNGGGFGGAGSVLGGGGGGASDVRRGGDTLTNRIIVAGGGGGGAGDIMPQDLGGDGGGPTGGDGAFCHSSLLLCPGGGPTQGGMGGTSEGCPGASDGGNGTLGVGGTAGACDGVFSGGGGGGGLYGGGGGSVVMLQIFNMVVDLGGGGGGGSGFVTPTATDQTNEAGVRSGNGAVTITYTPTLPGNILATTFTRCTTLHVGYNRFINGTVVHWSVTTNGVGTVASGQFNAIGGGNLGSKTYHFLDIPLGTTLPSEATGIQSHVLFTWADGGRFYATRDPGC